MLYIVIPQFNKLNLFYKFVQQLEAQTFQDYKIIIVDHGTEKISYEAENAHIILGSPNGWFCYAANRGIEYVIEILQAKDEDHILIINTDAKIEKNYLENVIKSIMLKPKAAIGSCCYDMESEKILYVNLKLDRFHAKFRYLNRNICLEDIKNGFYNSDVLKGLGSVWPVYMLKSIGLYDEKKLPHYKGDHELSWRAKKMGYELCVSGFMKVGAKLDSPNKINANNNFIENYKKQFLEMRSTQRIADLWKFSFACFGKLYGIYFFVFNLLWSHAYFIYKYNKVRHIKSYL